MSITLETPISAYLRASSFQQEKDSHERQLELIKRFLLDNDLTIAPENWFSDFRARDAAAFAKDFQTLLAKVRRQEIKTVLVSNLDRWGTADVDEFFEFRGILLKNGCKLWSVEDGDLTSKEMVQLITLIVKAEQSREYVRRMAKNIASGKQRKASLGHVQGGKTSPYGYDRVCYNDAGKPLWLLHYETPTKRLQFLLNKDGTLDTSRPPVIWEGERQRPPKTKTDYIKLVPSREFYGDYRCVDGDRVATVQLAFRLIIEKPWSIRKTARHLNDLGHRHYGHDLTQQRLQVLISNEKYRGDMTFNKTCKAKYARCVQGQVQDVTPQKFKSGRIKTQNRPEKEWDVVAGSHTGLVDAKTWTKANEEMQRKKKQTAPRSNEFYLSGLLWCVHCGRPMSGKMQQRTGPKKTRVRYPGYECVRAKDANSQIHSHWIPHATVEKWLFEKIADIGREVDLAQDVQQLLALRKKYDHDDAQVDEFLHQAAAEYTVEIRAFYDRHCVSDTQLFDAIATVCRNPGWDFTQKGADASYNRLREQVQEIDARKVAAAKRLLEMKKQEHRQATLSFIKTKDELTQQVIQEEVERLAQEVKVLEDEAVPFLDRYREKVRHLEEFRARLEGLIKGVREANVDNKAQRLREAIERIELVFLPYQKWQRNRLDTEKSRIVFRAGFGGNDPFA